MTSICLIQDELAAVFAAVDPARLAALADTLSDRGRRWFTSGQGRSRLVASMAAMRFMHVGFDAHVVGEATAPSIGAEDALLVLSGSGETPTTLHLASRAAEVGASIVAVTACEDSSLARMADLVVPIPVGASRQFGGSLFEQSALLLLDALVLDLTHGDLAAYDTMQQRHANLE